MRCLVICFLLLSFTFLTATDAFNSIGTTERTINYWTGLTSTAWGITTNWSQGHVPLVSEDVIISNEATRFPVIATGTRVCNNLGIIGGASLTITNGSLTVSSDLGVDTGSTLTVNGGTLTVQMGLGIETGATGMFTGGTVNVNDDCLVNGNLTVSNAGTYANFNYCTVSGTLNLTGADLNISYDLTVSGNLNISNNSSDLYVYDDLIFASGAHTNITDSANIHIQGNLQTNSGSAVNITLNTITFFGTGESVIATQAATTLNNLTFAKDNPGSTIYHSSSTADLTLTGNLTVANSNTFYQTYVGTLHLQGNMAVYHDGNFQFNAGTLSLEGIGSSQISEMQITSYFNHLVIAKANMAQTVSILGTVVMIKGNLTINTGVFYPQTTSLGFYGDWTNNAGPDGFNENTIIVRAMGSTNQYMHGTEIFNTLMTENPGATLYFPTGSNVTCENFFRTGHSICVNGGTFVTNFTSEYLYGTTTVTGGMLELHWPTTYSMDLRGVLNISGTGLVRLFGGSQNFQLANFAGNQFIMSGGTLDVMDHGIGFSSSNPTLTFASNVNGGYIRTGYNFTCERTDFLPTGGTLQLYGPVDANLSMAAGSRLYNLSILKDAVADAWEYLASDITVKGNIFIESGKLFGSSRNIYLEGNFNWGVGVQGFYPETSTLYAVGTSGIQYINVTQLYNLVDGNTGSGIVSNMYVEILGTLTVNRSVSLNSNSNVNIVLNTVPTATLTMGYPSTINYYEGGGTLNIPSNCSLVIADISEAGLTGNINVNGGTLDITQMNYIEHLWLDGNLTITNNGTVNLRSGGMYYDALYMGTRNAANLTMDSGLLDLIHLYMLIDHTQTTSSEFNITGGTIRCSGTWYDYAGTFDPSGGTVEFYEDPNTAAQVHLTPGSWFNNLTMSKSTGWVSLNSTTIKGNLTVSGSNMLELIGGNTTILNAGDVFISAGVLNLNGYSLIHSGNVYVNGELRMNGNSTLKMANGKSLTVYNGGKLTCLGDETSHPMITHNETGYYICNLGSGSTISAENAIFEYMGADGINIKPGASVDPEHSLNYCTFRAPVSGGRLLTVNNSQNFTINRAHFPGTEFYGGSVTVYKNQGTGTVTFMNADGVLAGPYWEYDPTNQINWDWQDQLITLQISRDSLGRIVLNWESELQPIWFRVFRSDTFDGTYSQIAEISYGTFSYSEFPPAGTQHFYYVKAAWY
jgi:hypothetical protein